MFRISLFILVLAIKLNEITANSSLSPLTKLKKVHECHQRTSILSLECNIGYRIRVLEAFYGVSVDPRRDYCHEGYKEKDCKSQTSFQNTCNGRSSCSLHFFKAYLNECQAESNYLTVSYECVPESRIHSVCSNVDELTSWGTLRTTDLPITSSMSLASSNSASNSGEALAAEDCWCKLVADNNQRIVLSVISFQLFPYDPQCTETGLYLQSDRKRSKDCTFLQQGHYYISSSKNLYLNFYSRRPIFRGGFWIIYEASDGKSKIHLKCGDTDEVRPSDFTRFSTQKQVFTPYIVEMQSTTTPPLQNPPVVDEIYNSWWNKNVAQPNNNNQNFYEYNNIYSNGESIYQQQQNNEAIAEINKAFVTSPPLTKSTRPITNTFNLLNRKTTKQSSTFAVTPFEKVPIGGEHIYVIPDRSTSTSTSTTTRRMKSTTNPFSMLNSNENSESFIESVLSFKNHFSTTTTTTTTRSTKRTTTTTTTTQKPSTTTKYGPAFDLFSPTIQPNDELVLGGADLITSTRRTAHNTKKKPASISSMSATSKMKTKMSYTTISILDILSNFKDHEVSEGSANVKSNNISVSGSDKNKPTSPSTTTVSTRHSLKLNTSTTTSTTTKSMKSKNATKLIIGGSTIIKDMDLSAYDYSLMANKSSNKTEFMSSIGFLDTRKKSISGEFKEINQMHERKLSRTELTIIISCVLFIALLSLINLLIYTVKKIIKKSDKQKQNETSLTDPGKKSYDILPGVGEIVLWAAKDKRGYLIDINGSWAKIDGQRWIRENMAVLHNTYKKASMAYRNRFRKKEDKRVSGVAGSNGISSSVTGVDDIHLGSSPLAGSSSISAAALAAAAAAAMAGKDDTRLLKRVPPTSGIYSLPPVPEAAEYELSSSTTSSSSTSSGSASSDNSTSSASSTLNEDIRQSTIESEYHIEHGKINSFVKKSKKFCQAPIMSHHHRNSQHQQQQYMMSSADSSAYFDSGKMCHIGHSEILTDATNESNYYGDGQENQHEPYAHPDLYTSGVYSPTTSSSCNQHQQQLIRAMSMSKATTVGQSDTETESAPIIVKRPILIRGDVEFLKNFPVTAGFNNESAYYTTDNRTIEVFQYEKSLKSNSGQELDPKSSSSSSCLSNATKYGGGSSGATKELLNVQEIVEKTESIAHLKHQAHRLASQPLLRTSQDAQLADHYQQNPGGVKLDPSILKYSNQPVAIVAPNKSNSNTLERKKNIDEIPTISLRTVNNQQQQQRGSKSESNKQAKSTSVYHSKPSTSSLLVSSEIEEYEQSLQALSLDEMRSRSEVGEMQIKSPKKVVSTKTKAAAPIMKATDSSSLLLVDHRHNNSGDGSSSPSTSSPSSSSSLIMDAKDLYDFGAASTATTVTAAPTSIVENKSTSASVPPVILVSNRATIMNATYQQQQQTPRNLSIGKKSSSQQQQQQINSNCSTPTNVTPIPKSTSSSTAVKKLQAATIVESASQPQPQPQYHRDSGFIEAISSSIMSLNDEEPNPVVLVRKPPLGPLSMAQKVSGHHYYQSSSSQQRSFFDDSGIGMIQEKESSFNNSSSTEIIGAANDEKGLIVQQPNRRGSIGKSPQHGGGKHNQQVNYASFNLNNTVLFNNDEHSLMNSKEISSTVLPSNNTSNIDDPEFIRLQNGLQSSSKSNLQRQSQSNLNQPENDNRNSVEQQRKFTSAMQKASQIENIINKQPQKTTTDSTQHHQHHINDVISNTPSWLKRQTTNHQTPPPPPQEESESSTNQEYVNPEEYQFFINAIEKLKATNLFHEEDIRRMSDEQIYDALVEHARKQKLKQRLMAAHQLSMSTAAHYSYSASLKDSSSLQMGAAAESIDARDEDEDLPIIMKNLHSVKSLKHFFEIRAKSTAAATSALTQPFTSVNLNEQAVASNAASPQINQRNLPPPAPPLPGSSSSHDVFIKSSNPLIERSIKHGVGLVNKDVESEFKLSNNSGATHINTNKPLTTSTSSITATASTIPAPPPPELSSTNKQLPIAPPLPDFLTQAHLSSTSSLAHHLAAAKKAANSKNGTLTSNSAASNPNGADSNGNNNGSNMYMSYNQDLHEKLIKEIHNKSLERSRKDSSIFLDEHGNLINKPTNRVYSSSTGNPSVQNLFLNTSQFKLHKLGAKFKENSGGGQQHSVIAEKITQLTQKSHRHNHHNHQNNNSGNEIPIGKFIPHRMSKQNIANNNSQQANTMNPSEQSSQSDLSSQSKASYENTTIVDSNAFAQNNEKRPTTENPTSGNDLNNNKNNNTSVNSSNQAAAKLQDKSKQLATETTSTMISLNIDESKGAVNISAMTAAATTLPCADEVNDSYVMITKSVHLMNQLNGSATTDDMLNTSLVVDATMMRNSSAQKNIDQINDEIKKDKMSMQKSHHHHHHQHHHHNQLVDEANDHLLSISQAPSVMQTLDRKNQIIDLINGHAAPTHPPTQPPSKTTPNNFNLMQQQQQQQQHHHQTAHNTFSSNTNNNPNQTVTTHGSNHPTMDYKRATSIRSDFSTMSSHSTRSMLSEAKAKLEAFSGGKTAGNKANSGTSYLNINRNFEHKTTAEVKEEQNYYETCDFIQTKF